MFERWPLHQIPRAIAEASNTTSRKYQHRIINDERDRVARCCQASLRDAWQKQRRDPWTEVHGYLGGTAARWHRAPELRSKVTGFRRRRGDWGIEGLLGSGRACFWGCARIGDEAAREAGVWHTLRGAGDFSGARPGVSRTRPPATICHPFGLGGFLWFALLGINRRAMWDWGRD